MATDAPFGFHGQVFEDERSLLFPVTFETDLILRRAAAELLGQKSTMFVVTIAALDESLVDAMAKGTAEFRPDFGVAAITQLGLIRDEQRSFALGVMWRVAGEAANIIAGMRRTQEVGVFIAVGMTGEAVLAGLLCGQGLERNDLRFVTAGFDVRGSWSVAILTSVLARLDEGVMRGAGESFVVDVFVTGLAALGAGVLRLRWTLSRRRLCFIVRCCLGCGVGTCPLSK